VKVHDDGSVAMTGAWRGPSTPTKYEVARLPSGKAVRALGYRPGPLVRAAVPFRIGPASCGVRVSTTARAGDLIEYSVFLDPKTARTGTLAVADRASRTTFNRPGRVTLEAPYYSSIQRLVRARIEFGPLPAGPLEITACPRP
jgi:hypothetical protein